MLLITAFSKPVAMPDSAKIRIHVPVKHHTHLHTKTVVKTVHVGIPVKPVKHHDDEDNHGWDYPKKKKTSNYIKLLNN